MSSDRRSGTESKPNAMRRNGIAALLLLAVTALADAGALGGWWLNDDPQVLLQAYTSNPFRVLFDPSVWKTLSASNFTPLVTLSFQFDLAIAGLRPWFFYLHQIVAIFVAAVLLERLLRRYIALSLSLAAAAIFLIAPQTVLAARMLMVRHYVEGLALALGALLLWDSALLEAVTKRRRILLGAAAFLYLFSMLAKEVYAPLPLLFLVIALVRQVPLRRAAVAIVPVATAAILYIGWRVALLGSAGGYGSSVEQTRSIAVLLESMFGQERWRLVSGVTIVAILFVLALIVRFRGTAIVGVSALVFVAIPLVPVLGAFQPRYGFVPTVVVVSLGAIAASVSLRRDFAWLFVVLAIPMIAAGQTARLGEEAFAHSMRAEGKYIWSGSGHLLFARSPSWYLEGIADLRRLDRHSAAPPFVCSTYGLALEGAEGAVAALTGSEALTPIDIPRVDEAKRLRARIASSLPLQVDVSSRDATFEWKLSPSNGRWVFVSYPTYDAIEIPPSGSRRVPAARGPQYFRIVREMPNGRWNVTPPLQSPADGERTQWRNF